jgi:hypothetical protein
MMFLVKPCTVSQAVRTNMTNHYTAKRRYAASEILWFAPWRVDAWTFMNCGGDMVVDAI